MKPIVVRENVKDKRWWNEDKGPPLLTRNADSLLGLEPGKKYRLYAEEVPEYPRYFVDPGDRSCYWHANAPNTNLVIVTPNSKHMVGANESEWYNRGFNEVTKSEAEAHIREQEHNLTSTEQHAVTQCIKEMPSEPGKCVWKRADNCTANFWPQCEESPDCADKSMAQNYCTWCGRRIELQESEPEVPTGYREPEEWEKECAEPPVNMRAKERGAGEWLRGWKRKRWPSEILYDRIFVPADWTPLPKCRDCGHSTRLGRTASLYVVRCTNTPDECTRSGKKTTKVEAVNAYPKGE